MKHLSSCLQFLLYIFLYVLLFGSSVWSQSKKLKLDPNFHSWIMSCGITTHTHTHKCVPQACVHTKLFSTQVWPTISDHFMEIEHFNFIHVTLCHNLSGIVSKWGRQDRESRPYFQRHKYRPANHEEEQCLVQAGVDKGVKTHYFIDVVLSQM